MTRIRKTPKELPDWHNRSALNISPGLYRMRNGHTAKVEKRIDIPFNDIAGKSQIYTFWKFQCVECNETHTCNVNGTQAPVGKHSYDLLKRL